MQPRLWTPPLRELTPETSEGFDQIRYARNVLMHPADPWQEWLFIHAGELLPDGVTPRFRIVLVLVSRQNGKTECLVILTAYWQFLCRFPMILGTSTKLDYAKESWVKAVELVERAPALTGKRPRRWTRTTNGEQESWTLPDPETGAKSRYKIAASNAEGGRSLTINRLIMDELRQHHDYAAWNAAEPAASLWDSQIWALSNAGDDKSVVLNELRAEALAFIKWTDEIGAEHVGELLAAAPANHRIGLFEWSAPEDADPTDIGALCQANPNLGLRRDPAELLAEARGAVGKGGEALTGFKTNYMCIRVPMGAPAIDPGAWARCLDAACRPADTDSRRALCLDVAPDSGHVTLATAVVLADDRVLVGIVGAWDSIDEARKALPALLRGGKAKLLGWFPGGPGAALAADLADRSKPGRANRPALLPSGMKSEEIRGELTAVCMGFGEQVTAIKIVHPGDELLNDHVSGAERLKRGDGWVLSRKGHVDAAYAVAGAVHLARTMPPPVGKPRLILPPPS